MSYTERIKAVDFCLSLPGSSADTPFEGDFDTTVVRHVKSRKWFGLFMNVGGKNMLNLKCDPDKSRMWQSLYTAVIPAYHMNKTHWITVYLDEPSVDDIAVMEMIEDSYGLTKMRKDK